MSPVKVSVDDTIGLFNLFEIANTLTRFKSITGDKFAFVELNVRSIKIDLDPSIKIFPFSELELKKRSIELDQKTLKENYKNFISSQKHYHKVSDVRPAK